MRRFLMFVCVFLLCLPAANAERYLRVVAKDNGPEAQRDKMMVRNLLLLLGPAKAEKLESIRPDCRVERKIWQPDEKTPPAETVHITIGPGAGKNWWGVLYGDAVNWAAEGTGERHLSFPFLEWLRALFIPRSGSAAAE